MKKTAATAVVAIVVVLGLLLAVLPALLGLGAQNRINALAENASSTETFRVSVSGYQRGWFASQASLTVTAHENFVAILEPVAQMLESMPNTQMDDENERARAMMRSPLDLFDRELLLTADVRHGPILTRDGLGTGFADVLLRADPATPGLDVLLAMLDAESLGEWTARIGFWGNVPYRQATPAFTISLADLTLAMAESVAEGTYDISQRRHVNRGHTASLEVSMSLMALEFEDITGSNDMTMIDPALFLWSGSSELTIGNVSISVLDTIPVATLANLSALLRSEPSGHLGQGSFEMQADSAEFAVFGSAQNISDLNLNIGWRNTDANAMRAYQDVVFQWMREADMENPGAAEEAALFEELLPVVHDLLMAEPELEIGPLSFNWNGGTVRARALVRIDNEMLPARSEFAQASSVPMDSELLTRLVSAEAELEVDDVDLEQSLGGAMRQPIAMLSAMGFLEATERGYRFRGSWENGVVEVNGEVISSGPGAQQGF